MEHQLIWPAAKHKQPLTAKGIHQAIVLSISIATILLMVLTTYWAMQNQVKPSLPISYDAKINHLVLNHQPQPEKISAFVLDDQSQILVKEYWLAEAMQKLNTVTIREQFLSGEAILYQQRQHITGLITESNTFYPLELSDRPISDFSVSFWLHRLFAAILMFFSLWVYYLSPKSEGAIIALVGSYAFGIGWLIATSSFDRLWAISSVWIEWNFIVARFLVMLFAASVFTLSWQLPQKLFNGRFYNSVPLTVLIVLLVLNAIGYTSIIESVNVTYIYPYTLTFITAIILLVFKTYKANRDKNNKLLDWVSLRWVMVAAVLGVSFPVLYNFMWDMGVVKTINPVMANAPAIVFKLGLSALVIRDKLYQLETIWWKIWSYLVAVSTFIGLVFSAHLFNWAPTSANYLTMLFVAGLFAIAAKQYLTKQYLLNTNTLIAELIPQILSLGQLPIDSTPDSRNDKQWVHILQQAFKPSQYHPEQPSIIETCSETISQVTVADGGTCLLVPRLSQPGFIRLICASNGMRLFTSKDAELAQFLFKTASLSVNYAQAQQLGESKERKRIAADLHDDIGGKLLYLTSFQGEFGRYARDTLEDLRTLTRGLNTEKKPFSDLVADLNYQIYQRCDIRNITCKINTQIAPHESKRIPAPAITQLSSIISELVRNALQHQAVKCIEVQLSVVNDTVCLEVNNDGAMTDPQAWKNGLGLVSLRRRIHDMHGSIDWTALTEVGVSCQASWPLTSWLTD